MNLARYGSCTAYCTYSVHTKFVVHGAADIFFVLNTSSTESFAAELLATQMTLITQLRQHRRDNSRNSRVSGRVYGVEDGTTCSKNTKIVSYHKVGGSRAYGLLPDYGP